MSKVQYLQAIVFFHLFLTTTYFLFWRGIVLFQVTMGMASEEHYLAYIEEFFVEEDGHLLYITKNAGTLFVANRRY